MLSLIKFLKIVLPVATVTSATIATTFLVSSSRDDLLNKEKEEDSKLTDFVNLNEDFQEKKLFYAKQGDGDGTVALGKEESEKLQKLIDEGADINNLGNRSNNVPDATGGPSQAINMPPQGVEPPKGAPISEDNSDSGSNAEAKLRLSDEEKNKASRGPDSSEKPDDPNEEVGAKGNDDDDEENTSKGSVSDTPSKEDLGQQGQQPKGQDEIKEEKGSLTSPTNDEQDSVVESQPQGDGTNNSRQNEENLKEKQSESQSTAQVISNEDGGSVTEPKQDSAGSESGKQVSREFDGESEGHQDQQQQDRGQGDLSGSSDENKFDLETLQRWQNELGSAQSALNAILSEL